MDSIKNILSIFLFIVCNPLCAQSAVIHNAASLKARALNACTPGAAQAMWAQRGSQVTPKPRNALVHLLLRAHYRMTDNESRVKLVRKAALQDRTIALAYQCVADDCNAPHTTYDAKTLEEILSVKDDDGKTIAHHAIDHRDKASIKRLANLMTEEQKADAVCYAGNTHNAQVLAMTSLHQLTALHTTISSATLAHVNTFYTALDLIKKRRKLQANAYKKIASSGTIAARLPQELQGYIQEMLHSENPYEPGAMMPALEQAIIDDNVAAINHARQQDCDMTLRNKDGMNALELAAYHGQSNALRYMVEHSLYTSEQQLQRLVEITTDRMLQLHTMTNAPEQKRLAEKLEETMHYLEQIPDYIREKNTEITGHILLNDFGKTLNALHSGANPNAKNTRNDSPITRYADDRPSLMKLLLKNGADVNAIILSNGIAYPLLHWVLFWDQEENFTVLLEHNADVEIRDGIGRNLLFESLFKDVKYMRALLAKGANSNSKVRSTDGDEMSLLDWAINKDKPEHAKLLLEHGADPNYISYTGRPLTWEALWKDNTEFLRLLLKHGANPNLNIRSTTQGHELSLLAWAFNKDKLKHAKILMEYGARYGWKEFGVKHSDTIKVTIAAGIIATGIAGAVSILHDLYTLIHHYAVSRR